MLNAQLAAAGPPISIFCTEIAPGARTSRSSVVGAAFTPTSVSRSPAAIVLVYTPAAALVTSTVTVQVPGAPAGICAPAPSVTVSWPGIAVTLADRQVVTALAGLAMTTPAGRLSTRADDSVAGIRLLLLKVNVNWLTPKVGILSGAKVLTTAGGTLTRARLRNTILKFSVEISPRVIAPAPVPVSRPLPETSTSPKLFSTNHSGNPASLPGQATLSGGSVSITLNSDVSLGTWIGAEQKRGSPSTRVRFTLPGVGLFGSSLNKVRLNVPP